MQDIGQKRGWNSEGLLSGWGGGGSELNEKFTGGIAEGFIFRIANWFFSTMIDVAVPPVTSLR